MPGLCICSLISHVKDNFFIQLNGRGLTSIMIANHSNYFC